MPRPVDAVLVGAGMRGYYSHGRYAREHPDTLRFVAVAELDAAKRERFARAHDLPPERCFGSWEELVAHEQLAPVLINATNDGVHFASTMGALEAGYDVLLEKPIASTLAESVTWYRRRPSSGGPCGSRIRCAILLSSRPSGSWSNRAVSATWWWCGIPRTSRGFAWPTPSCAASTPTARSPLP